MSAADELCYAGALELAERVRARDVSPLEIAEAHLDRIARVNPELNAFVYHDADKVRADAQALTAALDGDEPLGPLHGVPYSIKELTSMDGLPLTFCMIPLKDNVGTRDAAVARRMREAGGLLPRQDELARERLLRRHRQPPLRAHAQRLGAGAHRRRLERWSGCRGGLRPRSAGRGQRRRRIGAHPGLAERRGGAEAVA